jgi:hypothetical protein
MTRSTLLLFVSPGFLVGLGLGSVTTLLVALATKSGRRREPLPIAGLLLASITLIDLSITQRRPVPLPIWAGVALLAIAGWLWGRGLPWLGLLLAAPGAALTASGGAPFLPSWLQAVVAITVLAAGPWVVDFDRHYQEEGLAPPLLTLSLLGVLFTVPNTRLAVAALAGAIPLSFLGWPLRGARLGASGTFAVLGIMAWVIAAGGQGRDGSVIGAIACLGLLVIEPFARWLRRGPSFYEAIPSGLPRLVLLGGTHLAVVSLASRVAGLRQSAGSAASIAVPLLLITTLVSTRSRLPRGNQPSVKREQPDHRGE